MLKAILKSTSLTAVFLLSFLMVQPVALAANIDIEFQNTPLFSEADLKPGDEVIRWVRVTNNTDCDQPIGAQAINYPGWPIPADIPSDDLSRPLDFIISAEGGSDVYGGTLGAKTLFDFYGQGETLLSTLLAHSSTTYNFKIMFPQDKGNEWQTRTTGFDIMVGSQSENINCDDGGGGDDPIVKAKWEANPDRYTDASTAAGAQLTASGQYQVNTTIAFCAIATDPDGLADIDNVYADIFYPVGIALGDSHVPLTNQSNLGCGGLIQEDSLIELSKADGLELFCNKVRNLNNNLPTFASGYDYDEICALDGELWKETAAVYCGTKDISYEDPAGLYKVWAVAQDRVGNQTVLENEFEYLPTTAFETDFTAVSYGNVRLNTHKIISGNLTWEPISSTRPSVRNVGNTRLQMSVWQDDMGLGKTGGLWNVEYDARVGSNAPFAVYSPTVTTSLLDYLDLSELDEMDFSIDVSKFPPTHASTTYTGLVTLSAAPIAHLTCE